MKIILFHSGNKIVDKAVKFFTKDDYRHAAIMFPEFTGQSEALIEATGWKNGTLKYRTYREAVKNKTVTVIDIKDTPVECFYKAENLIGRKYDWLGFFGYPLNSQNPKYIYCFEFILKILAQMSFLKPLVKLVRDGSVSGRDIENILSNELIAHRITKNTYSYDDKGNLKPNN